MKQLLRKWKVSLKSFMLLKNIQALGKPEKVIITLTEHIGDIVACEPVARYARKNFPGHSVYWIVNKKFRDVLKNNSSIDFIIEVNNLSEWIFLKKFIPKRKWEIIDLHIHERKCTRFGFLNDNPNNSGITLQNYFQFGNLLQAFCLAAGLPPLNDRPVLTVNDEDKPQIDLPKKYIVIHTTSNEDDKNWPVEKWTELATRLIAAGNNIIEVGLKQTVFIDKPEFSSLCGQLSLPQIAWLIKRSKYFIGVDSAFAHFANAVETPFSALLGTYRIFDNYNPYSGPNAESYVIRHAGSIKELPVETVFNKVVNVMQ